MHRLEASWRVSQRLDRRLIPGAVPMVAHRTPSSHRRGRIPLAFGSRRQPVHRATRPGVRDRGRL